MPFPAAAPAPSGSGSAPIRRAARAFSSSRMTAQAWTRRGAAGRGWGSSRRWRARSAEPSSAATRRAAARATPCAFRLPWRIRNRRRPSWTIVRQFRSWHDRRGDGGILSVMTTILLIEDDEATLQVAAETLRATGYRVVAAADFQAAFEFFDSGEAVDLMITDIRMPPGTPHGFAMARMARSR